MSAVAALRALRAADQGRRSRRPCEHEPVVVSPALQGGYVDEPAARPKGAAAPRARRLMLARMLDAGSAGRQVGYLSASQFSREYTASSAARPAATSRSYARTALRRKPPDSRPRSAPRTR